jgi:hypothetical protein
MGGRYSLKSLEFVVDLSLDFGSMARTQYPPERTVRYGRGCSIVARRRLAIGVTPGST